MRCKPSANQYKRLFAFEFYLKQTEIVLIYPEDQFLKLIEVYFVRGASKTFLKTFFPN